RASGLLAQFQGLTPVEYTGGGLNVDSSSAMTNQISEDSGFNVFREMEDSTELSQSSFAKGSCSQEEQTDVALGSHLNVHESLCQDGFTNADNVASALPETHHQLSTSDMDQDVHLQEEFSQGMDLDKHSQQEFSQGMDLHLDIDEVPKNFVITDSQASNELAGQFQDTQIMHSSENGGSLIPYAVTPCVPILPSVSGCEHNINMMCEGGTENENCFQSEQWQDISIQSGAYSSEAASNFSAPLYPLQTSEPATMMVDPLYYQSSVTSLPPPFISSYGASNASDVKFETSHYPVSHQDLEVKTCHNASGDPDQNSYISSKDDRNRTSEPMDSVPESEKKQLVDLEQSCLEPAAYIGEEASLNHGDTVLSKKEDAGPLCYEPPCFPSFEVPFVSCELVTSSDLPEYSPLGIRELMRSSLNFPTPVRLWGSPTRDGSPDAVLKNAAKSFVCTPSIMKKRPRDLSSPIPDIRNEKKSNTEKDCGRSGMSSTRIGKCCMDTPDDFVDLVSPTQRTTFLKKLKLSQENKENLNKITDQGENEGNAKHSAGILTESSVDNQNTPKHGSNYESQRLNSSAKALSNSKDIIFSRSKPSELLGERSAPCIDTDYEYVNILADTPGIKRGLESPSAWKSPLFTPFQDAYFMSPASRGFDALGLVEQINEQSAAALEEAHEVLASGSPWKRHSKENSDKENTASKNELVTSKPLSKLMAEGRVLDFNECSTPMRKKEDKKMDIALGGSASSPPVASSYLRMNCFLLLFFFPASDAEEFVYNGFANADLSFEGEASIDERGRLGLTSGLDIGIGHAFYRYPVSFRKIPSDPVVPSFTTTFVFETTSAADEKVSDGLAFVLSSSNKFLNESLPGRYLGLFNMSNRGNKNILAIELGDIINPKLNTIDDNQVAINNNSFNLISSSTAGYYYGSDGHSFQSMTLVGGGAMQLWVEYDGKTQLLNVSLGPLEKPDYPLLSSLVNLSSLLPSVAYIGFSASTSIVKKRHFICGWSFKKNGEAPELNTSALGFSVGWGGGGNNYFPPPILPLNNTSQRARTHLHRPPLALLVTIPCFVLLVLFAVLGYVYNKRQLKKTGKQDWEIDCGQPSFTYKDLFNATNGFKDEMLLGRGGFGRVYKGLLPATKQNVAIKRISPESKQGMKEFISEITILGHVRHRSLVHLLGYCRHKHELLLVYDYMPSGSLDKYLYGQDKLPLATKATDIFAFGVFILEVTCGRRPIEMNACGEPEVIADHVINAWQDGSIMESADHRLEDCVYQEVELVLKLGLLCSHPSPKLRPGMRLVMQYLETVGTLPDFPLSLFSEDAANDEVHDQFVASYPSVATATTNLSGGR
ncbi:L-type lectin-domain containing receptor kinase IV.3, partial [Dichanthelium oligosanthes]